MSLRCLGDGKLVPVVITRGSSQFAVGEKNVAVLKNVTTFWQDPCAGTPATFLATCPTPRRMSHPFARCRSIEVLYSAH